METAKRIKLSLCATLLVCGLPLLVWGPGTPCSFGQLPPLKPGVGGRAKASAEDVPLADAQAPAVSVQGTETKLAEARANLAAAEALGEAAWTNAPAGVSLHDVAIRRALLNRLVRLYEQQLSDAAELENTKSRRAQLVREAQAWRGFAESPPYSVMLTDRLRQEIQVEQLKSTGGQSAVSMIDQLIGENRTALTQAEGKIRQLDEKLEDAKDPATVALLSWQREMEHLRNQVAAAGVGALDSERLLRQESLTESHLRLDWLQRQIVIADANARFTQADLDKVTARIESDRQQLERELSAALARSSTALQALDTARERLGSAQTGPAARAHAEEEVATRAAQLEAAQAAIRMLRLILEIDNAERTMWEMRYTAYDSRSVATLGESERRLEAFTRRLDLWKEFQQQELIVSSSQIELQQARVRNLAVDSDLLPLARERMVALLERGDLLQRLVRRIEQVQRLSQRWAEGLRVAQGRLPFFGRVQNLFSDTSSFLRKLWTFEVFTAEDTITVEGQKISGKRSVTLGKIILALLIVGVGIWITGFVSRVTESVIIRRLKIEANQARLIRRWLRALLMVCLVMFSLVSVKIPLTVFAFAGGALAIGLGFGTQTVLKNFVSGLILLFERPFRVGDVLDVGGQRGAITQIGLRASVLQLWDGTETLIPNSSLLENNVSNWTYSSRKVRFSVTVGVAYGSDIRRVIQLLHEVVERHGLVEKEPKPLALFTDFGDSALTFELRFWVDVIGANSAQVGSDLRQMIAGAFAENGIVISFPQRDIHLDTTRPVPVEIVPAPDQRPLAAQQTSPPEVSKAAQDT